MTGYLQLILGPMFSGKTSRLVDIYNECINNNIKVVVLNYQEDKRYHNFMLSTHDNVTIPCVFLMTITDIMNTPDFIAAKVVLINEGQFFADIVPCVYAMVENMNKNVYVCGLDGDFKRKRFGDLLDLIPICDSVTKLQSRCGTCHNNAAFSHRLTGETSQVVIGSSNYVPLCRTCYKKTNDL